MNQQSAHVISLNLKRRHLTASQKAAVAVMAEEQFAKEAKQRQASAGPSKDPGRKSSGSGKIAGSAQGDARDQAGQLLGVSGRYVSEAKAIKEKALELFEKVKAGTKTIRKRSTGRRRQAAWPPEPPKP